MAPKCFLKNCQPYILVVNAVLGHFFLCVISVTLPFKDREFKEVMDGRLVQVGHINTPGLFWVHRKWDLLQSIHSFIHKSIQFIYSFIPCQIPYLLGS